MKKPLKECQQKILNDRPAAMERRAQGDVEQVSSALECARRGQTEIADRSGYDDDSLSCHELVIDWPTPSVWRPFQGNNAVEPSPRPLAWAGESLRL